MTMPIPDKPTLTPAEVATLLSVTARTVRTLIDTEGLPAYRVGRLLRIPTDDLRAWLDERAAHR